MRGERPGLDGFRQYHRPLVLEGAVVVVGVPSLTCHRYAVSDAFERWRRAAEEDVERGRTFSWFKQATERTFI